MTILESALPPDAPAGSGATFRRWRGLEDVPAMAAANARLRGHLGQPEPADVDGLLHQYTHLVNSDPARDCILVERGGAVRGYARVEWHDLADGDRVYDLASVLEPSAWGLGIMEAMIGWGEVRSREIALEHPTDRSSHLANYVLGGDTGLATALAALGYTAVRWDAEMLRPNMEDLPAVVVPEGYVLRAPETGELRAVHEMAVSAFSEHWGEWEGADHDIGEWIEDPRFRRDLVVVAFHGTQPVTVLTNMVEPLPDGSVRGMLESLATHADHRRRGLARAAMARSLELLRGDGVTTAYLAVDTDNDNRALALYESCGFVVASTSISYRKAMPATNPTMTTPDATQPAVPAVSDVRFRRWQGIEDIAGMGAANAALRRLVGVVEPIDVEAMRHRYTHLVNSDPMTDCILVERDGTTLGYARVEWHDLADGDRIFDLTTVVDPATWGLGVAETFVRWGEVRAGQLAYEHPSDRTAHLANYAFRGDVELAAALEALGYRAVRWDAEMLRPHMLDLPAVMLADGYHLRAPEEAELPAVHQMMVEGFAEHWGEYEAEDHRIDDWLEDPRFRRDLVVVAWAGGRPASVVCNIVETAQDGTRRGLLDAVVTHPDHRRRGLARAAIARSLELLSVEGATSAYLGVDTGNHNQALALYESCGFVVASTGTSYRKPMPGTENRP